MAYTAVYVFGDSLVDSGNALKLAQWYGGLPFTDLPEGAPTVEDGYFKGRFSNGYTFADLVTNKAIGLVTKPIFPYEFEDPWLGIPIDPFESDPSGNNLNFAYGGAHIIQGDEVVPDFDGQTDAFRHAVDFEADPNALYMITLGGNDIRDLAQTGSDPVPAAEAFEVLDAAADKLLHELIQLMEIGAHHFAITGIPDIGLIPRYDRDDNGVLDATEAMRSAAATEYSIYLDALIRNEVVPALEALGADVTYVPLMDYQDEQGNWVTGALSANLPTIAALHGLTTEELSQNMLQHKELIFFDHVHPNAQANALLGSYMHALINDLPWIETLPLATQDVDYRMTGTIAAPGEVDKLVVSLVAGTTYTLEMLGVSSLGLTGSLADPSLRLLGPGGNLIGSDSDSGAGFDATLTFVAPTSGNFTVEFLSTGAPTGFYTVQAAVVAGAAMNAGNSYAINSATTVVLEGAGGVGVDTIRASVSYALSEGSEIEVLRTSNDKGKGAINLTGNEFAQTIVGNSGNNILDGKGGSDTLVGGGGKDVFVLGSAAVTSPANIDRISDYGSGDVVDVSQLLSLASGINPVTGGYLRVTTGGLVQVDLDGGGNGWVTLSTINNGGAVTLRYLSGGVATTVSVSRVSETQQLAQGAANGNLMLVGAAVAAAGLMAAPAAARDQGDRVEDLTLMESVVTAGAMSASGSAVESMISTPLPRAFNHWEAQVASAMSARQEAISTDAAALGLKAPAPLLEAPYGHGGVPLSAYDGPPMAATIAMPSAEMLQALPSNREVGADAITTSEVERIIVDALDQFGNGQAGLDAMLGGLATPQFASASVPGTAWDFGEVPLPLIAELAIHPDAAPLA